MSIDRLRAHYGFSRMPFGKDLAPGMLHAHGAHAEAVARIPWCIAEQAIGVISGECGAGKTVAARAAVAGLGRVPAHGPLPRHARGRVARDLRADHHPPRRHPTVSSRRADPPSPGAARRRERGARQAGGADHRRGAPAWTPRAWRGSGACRTWGWTRPPRSACCCSASQRCAAGSGRARSPRWISGRGPLRDRRPDADGDPSYVQHHLALAGRSDTLFSDDAIA